jgi:hypothetical protein
VENLIVMTLEGGRLLLIMMSSFNFRHKKKKKQIKQNEEACRSCGGFYSDNI